MSSTLRRELKVQYKQMFIKHGYLSAACESHSATSVVDSSDSRMWECYRQAV